MGSAAASVTDVARDRAGRDDFRAVKPTAKTPGPAVPRL
jgi:hypothetical protein